MARLFGRAKTTGVVATLGVLLVLSGGPVIAKTFTCALNTVCVGTKRADNIKGEGGNRILGNDGNDTINSINSNALFGEKGNDKLLSRGASVVDGGPGNDTIKEVAGIEYDGRIVGGNNLSGGPGDDTIQAPFGGSDLKGGSGDDDLRAKNGEFDVIDCGPGKEDTVSFDKGLDKVKNCEKTVG